MQQIKPENNIERFVEAQESRWAGYDRALREIADGRKVSHWMWYIFPQMRGLGHSNMSYFYGISGYEEAQEYYRHPVLGPRLREITGVLLTHRNKSAEQIFGPIDAVKLRSSMTLFHSATGDFQFDMVLYHFFKEQRCEKTLAILAEERRKALSSLP